MAKYGKKAQDSVEDAMHKMKKGNLKSGSGDKVTSRKQAVAIGLSEAREKGAKVPEKTTSEKKSSTTSRKSTGSTAQRKSSSASKQSEKSDTKSTRAKKNGSAKKSAPSSRRKAAE